MQVDWIAILPELFLAGIGFLIFCAGAFWRNRPSGLLFYMALAAAVGAGASAAAVSPAVSSFVGMVDVGSYANYFNFIFAFITGASLLFGFQYARLRGFSGDEFYGLLLIAALGMVLVASAVHWVIFFLGLELLSISLYILVAMQKGDPLSNEAGVKYFIMGAVASAILAFGIALIYALTGKMNIADSLGPAVDHTNITGVVLGLGLVLVGIGFKISLVPFHLWTPDVYQGAPAPVTAFMSTGSKVALIAALLRFSLYASGPLWGFFMPILWILAVLTMVIGNVTAIVQVNVKRLLAYSSIAQVGYIMMALLAVKQQGASAIMFYTAVYTLMDLGAFGTVALLSGEHQDLDTLDDYRGLGFTHPWKAALLTLCLFSLAGLPPTAGFIGKYVLFQATLQGGFIILAVIGILTAILSIYYYLKVTVLLYMGEEERTIATPAAGFSGDFATAAVFLLILWLGIVPSYVLSLVTRIASSLLV